jgi:hypothetical protein
VPPDAALRCTINNDGTFTVDSTLSGMLSSDCNIFAVIDTDASDNFLELIVGVRKSSSGKSNSSFHGTYGGGMMFDDSVTTGGYMTLSAGDLSSAGDGNLIFTETAHSEQPPSTTPVNMTLNISPDGTFTTTSDLVLDGIISPDNSVFVVTDTNEADDDAVSLGIAVKKIQ